MFPWLARSIPCQRQRPYSAVTEWSVTAKALFKEPSEVINSFNDVSLFIPPRYFNPAVPEMMDRPNADPSVLDDDLNNLRVINKYFGGLSAVRKNIIPLLKRIESGKTVTILDLATGSADHPLELAKLGKKINRTLYITAVDKNPVMLNIARERTKGYGNITVEEQDILNPDYPDKNFDIVLCSLAIHHFSREDAITILRQMNRLSRVGFIVNDLNRSWLGAWTAWLYTHITTRNPMTLYDSCISVLRAFTPQELKEMAREAGICYFTIKTQPFFRLVLVGEK